MHRLMKTVGAIALFAAPAAHAQPSPTTPPPPLVFSVPGTGPQWRVVSFSDPREAQCAEGRVRPVEARNAPPTVTSYFQQPPALAGRERQPPAFSYRFHITREGRVGGLAPTAAPVEAFPASPMGLQQDVQAALAAWRFRAGRAYSECRITFTGRETAVDTAPRPLLLELMASRRPSGGAAQIAQAALPPGSDCRKGGPPTPRALVFPDFDAIPRRAGGPDWVWLSHDLDGQGRPVNVRVDASSGNAALDAGSVAAVKASRYAPGARRGCLRPFRQGGEVLSAPPRPNIASFVRPGDTCPNTEGQSDRARIVATTRYPPNFQERGVEGWAIVRFDVAPWGEIGRVEVVASEPAETFGEVARNLVGSAKAQPGEGLTGCLQPVQFRLADEPPPPTETELYLR